MQRTPMFRLSVMMFLEFFIWGAWLPKIFGYLPAVGFDGNQSWLIISMFNFAAITAMFFSTQFADRNFAAEKFLAFSHVVGGLAMLGLGFTKDFIPFVALMGIHCFFYVPTISITNSVLFANVKDPQKEFGPIRLWGTIGWIAAAWPMIFLLADWAKIPAFGSVPFQDWLGAILGTPKSGQELIDGTKYTFITSGVASLILGAFSLMLPHTPPKPVDPNESQFAWLEAAKLLAKPFMLVLFVVTFFDAAVHQCYFVWTDSFLISIGIASNWTQAVMSIGQFAEIGTMFILASFLKRMGWKTTMIIGILGHAVRFGVFSYIGSHPEDLRWLAIVINILHGICYAFFFATVYIFVDEFFPKDVRSSAQGLFNLLILGIGPLVGTYIGLKLQASVTVDKIVNYERLFLPPALTALGAAALLLVFFYPPKSKATEDATAPAAH